MEPWMIEELKKEEAQKDQALQIPLYLPLVEYVYEEPQKAPDEDADRGVVIIQII